MRPTERYPEATDANFLIVDKKYITSDLHQLKLDLIAVSKYDEEKIIPMYGEDDTRFFFPRFYFKNRKAQIGRLHDETSKGSPAYFQSNINLWDYQAQAIDEFRSHVANGKTGIFLGAAPGSGKTQMGIKMLELLGRTAIIIVPKKDLIDQWEERLLATTSLKREEIGKGKGGIIDWINKKVVISLVHTAVKYIGRDDFQTYFGAALFDECDSSVPPETFAKVAWMFTAKYRIAMTASATRSDGLHVVFQNHLVEVEIICNKSNTLQPTIVTCLYENSSGELPYSANAVAMKGMLLSRLAKNQDRNRKLAEIARILYSEDRPVAIMSDRKSQLKHLQAILTEELQVPPSDIGFYVGAIDDARDRKELNKEVASNARIILATYGMMSRGTDIPRLECLVFATPRQDLRQICGRVERVNKNKKEPIIVDIIDTAYNQAVNAAEERYKYYVSRNLDVYRRPL